MHRWFDGTAFTKHTAISKEWLEVAEYETSACKGMNITRIIISIIITTIIQGWEVDADFIGAISVFSFSDPLQPVLDQVNTYWMLPTGEWVQRS